MCSVNVTRTTAGEGQLQRCLIYLDLNKWIDLARAEAGSEEGKRYEPALKAAEESVLAGWAVFPLSFAHFMEVAKIGDDTRRRNLACLMAKLSQGWFLRSASALLMAALRRAVAIHFQKPLPREEIVPVSRSLKTVFGEPTQLGFEDAIFSSPVVLEELIATARVSRDFVERWTTIARDHEVGRSMRWDVSREVRKRAYCALVTIGIQDRLALVLGEFGLKWKDLEDLGPDGCVRLLESVPFLDVEINLHTERNEQRDRRIAPNDEVDLGFLSLAVPYCRAVFTEKFWVSLVRRTELDAKYGTYVGHDLGEMIPYVRPQEGEASSPPWPLPEE